MPVITAFVSSGRVPRKMPVPQDGSSTRPSLKPIWLSRLQMERAIAGGV